MVDKKVIKMIIVEPRQAVRKPLFKHLKAKDGCAVKTAKTADEGLEKVRKTPPDLAVIYKDLPSMNGVELAWRMKEEHPSLSVLVTASQFTSDEMEFMSRVEGVYWLEAPRTLRDIVVKMGAIVKDIRNDEGHKHGKKVGKDGKGKRSKKRRRVMQERSPLLEEEAEPWPEPTRGLE